MPDLHTLDGVQVDAVPPEFALYPFGVFTTFILVDGSVLGWSDHVARLSKDARSLWGHELNREQLVAAVRAHARHVRGVASFRITLYPASLPVAIPAEAQGCRILVSSRPAALPSAPQTDFAVRTVEYEREFAELKSTSILAQLRLRREAQIAGFDDALFKASDEVREGATWTVLMWRGGEVATPDQGVLSSITAAQIGTIAEILGWKFRRRRLRCTELFDAQLVLAVNANLPVRAVTRIDAIDLAVDQNLLKNIAAAYMKKRRERVWL